MMKTGEGVSVWLHKRHGCFDTYVGVSLSIKVRTTSKGIFLTVMKETENLLYFLITLPRGVGVFWGGRGDPMAGE